MSIAKAQKPLRFAVIGLGVGEQHAEAVAANPNCALVAICDRDREKLAMVARRFPGVQTCTDDGVILRDPEIDVVCLASFDDCHFSQTVEALNSGKHVFVEKPFVLHEHEAQALRKLLRLHPELRLSSNLVLRTSPRFVDLKHRIDADELGTLYYVEADYNYGRLHKITEGWRGKLDFYSAVHGGGVHVADLLMWLAQDRVMEVSAAGNAIASAGSGFKNFDTVVAWLKFESGAVGKLGVNFGCVLPHFHAVSLYGTKATFINGRDRAWLYTSPDPALPPKRLDSAYPGIHKGALIRSFVSSILGEGAAEVGEDDVFASMSVCFAIEKSAHSGKPVAVDYL